MRRKLSLLILALLAMMVFLTIPLSSSASTGPTLTSVTADAAGTSITCGMTVTCMTADPIAAQLTAMADRAVPALSERASPLSTLAVMMACLVLATGLALSLTRTRYHTATDATYDGTLNKRPAFAKMRHPALATVRHVLSALTPTTNSTSHLRTAPLRA